MGGGRISPEAAAPAKFSDQQSLKVLLSAFIATAESLITYCLRLETDTDRVFSLTTPMRESYYYYTCARIR
jgi:uncharacterized membrane protein YozB (DUF420 family)